MQYILCSMSCAVYLVQYVLCSISCAVYLVQAFNKTNLSEGLMEELPNESKSINEFTATAHNYNKAAEANPFLEQFFFLQNSFALWGQERGGGTDKSFITKGHRQGEGERPDRENDHKAAISANGKKASRLCATTLVFSVRKPRSLLGDFRTFRRNTMLLSSAVRYLLTTDIHTDRVHNQNDHTTRHTTSVLSTPLVSLHDVVLQHSSTLIF